MAAGSGFTFIINLIKKRYAIILITSISFYISFNKMKRQLLIQQENEKETLKVNTIDLKV